MTFVLAVHGRESIRLVADRRLSYGGRRPPIDDAMKVVGLDTVDGVGLLAYAGLGATARGTQPSEWISNVLRGRGGIGFEESLSVLAAAANRELPRHLGMMRYAVNHILVPARLYGLGPRMFSIDNKLASGTHSYRFADHRLDTDLSSALRVAAAGSGANYLLSGGKARLRELLGLVKANDLGRVSDLAVADRFAELNWKTHRATTDGTVGPRCIVVWRRWPGSRLSAAGGGQQSYDGVDRESVGPSIPSIANGIDLQALVAVIMQTTGAEMAWALQAHESPAIDYRTKQQLVDELPSEPDEKLR